MSTLGRDDARAAVFTATDVRGVVGDPLDADFAWRLGRACADELGGPELVVGRDMRPSSPELARAFMNGVRAGGVATLDVGLCPTDLVSYAAGVLDVPGAMWTASHNPAGYNGLKLCRAGAAPVAHDTGLSVIRDRALGDDHPQAAAPGGHRELDLTDAYVAHARALVDTGALAGLRVAVDAGNGMAGMIIPRVLDGLGVDLWGLHLELDGTFPHHPADPLDAANLADLQAQVRAAPVDVGLAFDGDADRVVCVDEHGRVVAPSLIGAIIAERVLTRRPGATVAHNAICSRTVAETIERCGGTAVCTPVGHSLIKAAMRDTGALFGAEHSGHYYFHEHFDADSGVVATLVLLEALGRAGGSVSALVAPVDRYVASGEINRGVLDPDAAMQRVATAFAGQGAIDRLDGLTVSATRWWLNLRRSNTEPLLRLNVEGDDADTMASVRDRVLALVDT
jgi:phosphomannomutase